MNDGSQTIILSTKGKNQSEVPVELVRFLQYVAQETDEAETEDDYVKMLQERIKSIKKNCDWEGKYMLLEEMMREERMEGMQEGIQKGQERINQLNICCQSRIEVRISLKQLLTVITRNDYLRSFICKSCDT